MKGGNMQVFQVYRAAVLTADGDVQIPVEADPVLIGLPAEGRAGV